jgi:hypothetical protein
MNGGNLLKRATTRFACAALTAAVCAMAAPAAQAADEPVATDDAALLDTTDVFTGETATAEETAETEQTCTDPALSNPLAAFKDQRSYFLAPGGDFEHAAAPGWTLEGGATVAAGNEPFGVNGGGGSALSLPAGSSATSPVFCIDLNYPTFRFLAVQEQAAADAGLEVDVIYPELASKNVRKAAKYKPMKEWKLTKDVHLEPQTTGKTAGWRKVALRFRVPATKKGGAWKVDSILVDPRCRY